jgi:hypothetical protein
MTTQPRKSRLWERLDTPTKVISAIAASIAALVGAAATGAAFLGDHKTVVVRPSVIVSRSSPLAGQRISTCMQRHHMRAARISIGVPYAHNITFKRCDWPPLVPTSTDGFTAVSTHVVNLPKPEAAPYNMVETFRAPCDQLDVTFVLDHMSLRQFTSHRLALSRIYEVDGVPKGSLAIRLLDQVPSDVNIPLPSEGPRAFYVLHSGHFALFDAHCAVGRPPH